MTKPVVRVTIREKDIDNLGFLSGALWADQIWSLEARDWWGAWQYVLDQSAAPGLVV
jgi:hypothetical protein